jgi:hypothetical protein
MRPLPGNRRCARAEFSQATGADLFYAVALNN